MTSKTPYLIFLLLFFCYSCVPIRPVNLRVEGLTPEELRDKISRIFQFEIPKTALVMEAYSNGWRDPEVWCLLSVDANDSPSLASIFDEAWKKKFVRPEVGNLEKYIHTDQIIGEFKKYFELIDLNKTPAIAYPIGNGSSGFGQGVILLQVPERAWVLLYLRTS